MSLMAMISDINNNHILISYLYNSILRFQRDDAQAERAGLTLYGRKTVLQHHHTTLPALLPTPGMALKDAGTLQSD